MMLSDEQMTETHTPERHFVRVFAGLITTLGREDGGKYGEEDVSGMCWDERRLGEIHVKEERVRSKERIEDEE